MLWIVFSAIVVLLIYFLLKLPLKYWSRQGVKQSNPVVLFGDNWGPLLRLQSFADMMLKIYNVAGPEDRYTGFYQFYTPTLLIKDPDLIKQVTIKDFDHFTDHRGFIPVDADPLFGRVLFSLSGKKWHDMRATLSPTFTSSKMKYMFTLIAEAAENFVAFHQKACKSSENGDGVEVDLKDTFTRFTSDVIGTTAFGVKVDSLNEPKNRFYVMGRKATDFSGILRNLKFFGYMAVPWVMKIFKVRIMEQDITEFFLELVRENVREREERNIVRPDMIQLLMAARKGALKYEENADGVDTGFATVQESEFGKKGVKDEISDMDIAAQAMIFFFAGFDAVSTMMCFMGYELAVNPEIQERLREEVRETLKNCSEGKVTYEALIRMKYLDMVLSETLRKWPNAVGSDRICVKPYTIKATKPHERDLHIPLKSVIWLPIIGLHRDPKIYPEPEKFDPERFNDENKAKINPFTYIPFGVGPRNCIASRFALLETKVLFFHLLNSFEIVPSKKSVIPVRLCRKQFNLMAEGGFWFKLRPV